MTHPFYQPLWPDLDAGWRSGRLLDISTSRRQSRRRDTPTLRRRVHSRRLQLFDRIYSSRPWRPGTAQGSAVDVRFAAGGAAIPRNLPGSSLGGGGLLPELPGLADFPVYLPGFLTGEHRRPPLALYAASSCSLLRRLPAQPHKPWPGSGSCGRRRADFFGPSGLRRWRRQLGDKRQVKAKRAEAPRRGGSST